MLRTRVIAAALGLAGVVALSGCAAGPRANVPGDRLQADRIAGEVRALHAFFELWLQGEIPNTDEALARFADAIDDNFTLVTTDGTLLDRDGILGWVRANHGARPRFRLWTEKPRLVREEDGLLIAQYEEWQTIDGDTRGRVSTAIFKPDRRAPGGLRWIRVHETWLPEGSAPQP